MPVALGIESLPAELLYEVQLFALCPAFPYVSKRIYYVFKAAPTAYIARYIICRVHSPGEANESDIFTRALRYSSCSENVVGKLAQLLSVGKMVKHISCELPKRWFRNLDPTSGIQPWKDDDNPLPFLRQLYTIPGLHPDPNSHDGYALRKAVYARHEPLIRFLLEQGATPGYKGGLCVMLAIRQKNLNLVKMLIEREDKNTARGTGKYKKRRLDDRVVVNGEMLKLAVKCGAHDIAKYLTQEKGVIPDIQTLLEI